MEQLTSVTEILTGFAQDLVRFAQMVMAFFNKYFGGEEG